MSTRQAGTRVRQFFLTRYEAPEGTVQAQLLQVLQLHPRVAWAERMNTGAGHLARKDPANPGQWIISDRWLRFGFPGMSDILGQLKDGRLLAVEAKRRSGRLSEDQEAFLATVQRYGGVAVVARDAAELATVLNRC